MAKVDIVKNLTRTFHKVGFQLKKHSPEILVGVGVVGTVASAVMACKATTKLDKVLEEAKGKIDQIHEATNMPELADKYTKEDSKKDLAIVYAQTGLEFVKLYGPSVLLGAASIGCILKSHNIIRKRNVALAAAYTAVDKGFKDYRGRVIERFGKELDKELKYNIKAKTIEEKVVDENGEEKTVTKEVDVITDPNLYSDYARFYDCGCIGWTKNPELNLYFLKQQQRNANKILQEKGHLYLNEVYDMLGIPRSQAGQIVGWIYDEKCPVGDNFVDFGLTDAYRENTRDFVNGYERTVLLDFNVDGPILELMK